MTKYLHLIVFALVAGGWGAPVEADISVDGSQPTTASDTTTTATTHKSSHHKKHKSSSTVATTGAASTPTTTAPKTAGTAPASAVPTAPAGSDADLTGAAKPAVAKSSRKKRHSKNETTTTATGTTTAPTVGSTTTPAKASVTPAASAPGAATTTAAAVPGAAAAAATTLSKSAVTKSIRKKHHGKTETAAVAPTTTPKSTPVTTMPPASPVQAPVTSTIHAKVPAPSTAPTKPAPPPGAAVATAPTLSPQGAVTVVLPAVSKSSRRHRHGRGETAAQTRLPAPGATIVVTPSSVPLNQQPVPSITPMAPIPGVPTPAISLGPTVQTGLPIARPGAGTTATLIPSLAPSVRLRNPGIGGTSTSTYATPPLTKFPFMDYPTPPRRHTQTYPWKTEIITTVFWIGEGGSSLSSTDNYKSAWNSDWIHDNSGSDDQDDMSGYASSLHASTLNPFYIALPFNDLVYPDKARRWIPSSWFKPSRDGKAVSACQDRWIEIKNRAGRTCYAQWEDVGPLRYDHAEYVFGPERPDTLTHAGLDVSPAVALYLGIDRHGSAITSWRFVDDDDVQPGMWLKYDEQAIIFRALKEQARHTQPIQDMSEPTPDDNTQDANQKKAGAARG